MFIRFRIKLFVVKLFSKWVEMLIFINGFFIYFRVRVAWRV